MLYLLVTDVNAYRQHPARAWHSTYANGQWTLREWRQLELALSSLSLVATVVWHKISFGEWFGVWLEEVAYQVIAVGAGVEIVLVAIYWMLKRLV